MVFKSRVSIYGFCLRELLAPCGNSSIGHDTTEPDSIKTDSTRQLRSDLISGLAKAGWKGQGGGLQKKCRFRKKHPSIRRP